MDTDRTTATRHANPFATCWTRPGALPFRFAAGSSAEQLVANLAAANWWGQVIGPHGSGKSTLLAALIHVIESTGRRVTMISLRDRQRRLPRDFWPAELTDCDLLIVDGYEQLAWLERLRLKWLCRRAGAGLLVTSHAPTELPTLAELAPDRTLIHQLTDELRARGATPVTPADVDASHARHGSNVREVFFDLYDRHERLTRATRTDATSPS